jgi:hypothetical protein
VHLITLFPSSHIALPMLSLDQTPVTVLACPLGIFGQGMEHTYATTSAILE